jgi:hypothetical protein
MGSFVGVLLKYGTGDEPKKAVDVIGKALRSAGIDSLPVPDPSQPPGVVYIYVGYKP